MTEAVFWASFGVALYAIAGYPLILLLLAKLRGHRQSVPARPGVRVSFLIPAHNEAAVIADKLRNTLTLTNSGNHRLSIVVISDGSTDDTVLQARSVEDPRVTVLETKGRTGKLAAINQALPHLDGDIVVFSDANAILSPQSLDRIMDHFGDPDIGGVCGQITIDTQSGGAIARQDAVYWRYDQIMKRAESDVGGVVAAQGSIYAIRRHLTASIPQGVADDFLMSVRVVRQGYRLAFEPEACTTERVTEYAADEMGRRIRSTEMGWRGLMMMKDLMNPARHGFYAWQLISHKFMRRLVPLCLAVMFVTNMALLTDSPFWLALGLTQIAFYGLAALAILCPPVRKVPVVPKIMFFCMGNLAMCLGLAAYYSGRRSSVWTPVRQSL